MMSLVTHDSLLLLEAAQTETAVCHVPAALVPLRLFLLTNSTIASPRQVTLPSHCQHSDNFELRLPCKLAFQCKTVFFWPSVRPSTTSGVSWEVTFQNNTFQIAFYATFPLQFCLYYYFQHHFDNVTLSVEGKVQYRDNNSMYQHY